MNIPVMPKFSGTKKVDIIVTCLDHGHGAQLPAVKESKDISHVATGQRKNALPETNIIDSKLPTGRGYVWIRWFPGGYISNILQQIRRCRTTTC